MDDAPDGNTGSEEAFRLASTWLSECQNNHRTCGASTPHPTPLPHRVIDVGSPEGLFEPRLLETSGKTGKYLTLSHCWGGESHIKTTTENISTHCTEIKIANLPRTFAEAVSVTRKLGIRYLWIDSLCIIQNDRKDWEVEAALMHQYYKQSLLTIAATDGNNSEAGLFRERDGLAKRPCELRVADTHGSFRYLYAYSNSMSFQLTKSSLSGSYKPTPLHSRAWVFQEQALSPRILTYGCDGISWRCQEMRFDEKAPLVQSIANFIKEGQTPQIMTRHGDPRVADAAIAVLQRKWIFPTSNSGRESSPIATTYHKQDCHPLEDEFLLDWGRTIQDYTARRLTRQSDKLIAIRGVAEAAAAVTARKYFAGIWIDSSRSIVKGLLWSSSNAEPKERKRVNVAPSWSWASVDSPVVWPGHWLCRLESTVNILELKSSGTAFKAVGELVLEVNLRTALMENGQCFRLSDWPDVRTGGTDDPAASNSRPILDAKTAAVSLDESISGKVAVWFAEVASGEIHSQGGVRYVHCLVLAAHGASGLKFRRVGYSSWHHAKWKCSTESPEMRRMKICIV